MVSPFNSEDNPPKYLNISTTRLISGLAWVFIAFPVSVAIIFAISSFSISMASAIWRSIFPLSLGITFDQDLNAFRDDFTAISTSASLPRGTVANILLFAGHSISIVFSVMLLVYLPSMII